MKPYEDTLSLEARTEIKTHAAKLIREADRLYLGAFDLVLGLCVAIEVASPLIYPLP